MAFVSAVTGDDATKKFMEVLQNDFKTLSGETRKKYPQIREACDEAVEKLSLASNNPQASLYGVVNQILYPLVQGCESKDMKIIKFCLGTIQRLIAQQGIDTKGARHIVDCLFNLGQAGVFELKLLQTAALLMTTSDLVHGDTLARTMVLCFRMTIPSEGRDASTSHAAAATGRQLVALVFERALAEQEDDAAVNATEVRPQTSCRAPKDLKPCAADAYLILQDIIQLINGDSPHWLVGITEIPKTFGLELLDTVLTDFAPVFFKITEFRFLLKEHVCALIIRLFSPNVKYRAAFTSLSIPGAPPPGQGQATPPTGTDRPHFPVSYRLLRAAFTSLSIPGAPPPGQGQATPPTGTDRPHFPVSCRLLRLVSVIIQMAAFTSLSIPGAPPPGQGQATPPTGTDRPHFPVSCRLLRLVSVIIHKYLSILVTECEIFLSLTIKFLDPDKPLWQRALALEVLHKMSIQPKLLASLCKFYDMKPHATNIFQDIVNALGAYVQSLFVASQINTPPGTQTLPQQSGFYWKGVWLPLCVTFEPGTAKSIYSEMLDRTEPASIQEGYGISVAYACLTEIIRSIALYVEGDQYYRLQMLYDETISDDENEVNSNQVTDSSKDVETKIDTKELPTESHNGCSDSNSNVPEKQSDTDDENEQLLKVQILKSSWCGLVWGLSVLAEASIGELETILQAIQTLARVCGKMGVTAGRDACVLALCRCALPAQCLWALGGAGASGAGAGGALRGMDGAGGGGGGDYRHVLWVGTPLPSAHHSPGQQQSFVLVSARHVAALRALLRAARRDGRALQHAWLPALTTMQHLVWILGLKPSTGGSMKATRASADANAVISTNTVMADLPALSTMLSKVFESSKNLDDVALHHLIDALCKLSNEAMELAYSNREPSLFAVAKLLETGLANLHRIEVMWRPITNHLLEVCQHPHIRMREWGVEAITYLVQAAFQYHHSHPNLVTDARSRLLLEPLAELCSVRHPDVRARQLECAARLLHSRGEQLGAAWPLMCDIIAAISPHDSPALVRGAFSCAQALCGELLAAAAPRCLRAALSAAAAFAVHHDLNIALTALSLMWNISDYLYHNRDKLSGGAPGDGELTAFPDLPQHADLPLLDKLFMCLYMRLCALCTEPRAPVRRAAAQTLFTCVCAHGTLLAPEGWRALLQALYPALHQVQEMSKAASSDKVDTGEHILIHHSRNTAQKQWAETQVLTISGVARVFHSRFQLLLGIDNFEKYWVTLLGFITDFALWPNHEVASASLKSFSSVISGAARVCSSCENTSRDITSPSYVTDNEVTVDVAVSDATGKSVAVSEATGKSVAVSEATGKSVAGSETTGKVVTVSDAMHGKLWGAVWRTWLAICNQVHPANESSETAVQFVPSIGFLTSLLQIFPHIFHHIRATVSADDVSRWGGALQAALRGRAGAGEGSLSAPPAADLLLHHADLILKEAASRPQLFPAAVPALVQVVGAMGGWAGGRAGRAALLARVTAAYCRRPDVISPATVIQALHSELLRKDTDQSASDMKRREEPKGDPSEIADLLIQVLTTALPLARQRPDVYKEFWDALPNVLEAFMFQHSTGRSALLVGVVRGGVLGGSPRAPPAPRRAARALLRRGTHTHRHTHRGDTASEAELREREEFARTCFETLLQYSMLEDIDSLTTSDDESDPLAIVALLDRFQEVLQRYSNQDGELPRSELSELSFVLKALTTLAESMKKAPSGKVDDMAWQKLIGIYPSLVGLASKSCVLSAGEALREAMLQFKDLLVPPNKRLS